MFMSVDWVANCMTKLHEQYCLSAKIKPYLKQESIRVGCEPSVCRPFPIVPCSGVDIPWTYPPPRTYPCPDIHTHPLEGPVTRDTHPPLWTEWLTDARENITSPQLLLRAVIILFHSTYLLIILDHIRPWQNQTWSKITLPTHDYTITFHVSAWSNMKLLFRVEKQIKCTAAEETKQ